MQLQKWCPSKKFFHNRHKIIVIPLLCPYRLFIHSFVSTNTIVAKYMIFYLIWYVIRWSSNTYKKSSFLSFHSSLFLVNKSEIENEKSMDRSMEWKMPLCKWMAPWLIYCFTVILLHIERKWLLKFSHDSPLKSKLSGKFQGFNVIYESIEMLKNSWISKNFN